MVRDLHQKQVLEPYLQWETEEKQIRIFERKPSKGSSASTFAGGSIIKNHCS